MNIRDAVQRVFQSHSDVHHSVVHREFSAFGEDGVGPGRPLPTRSTMRLEEPRVNYGVSLSPSLARRTAVIVAFTLGLGAAVHGVAWSHTTCGTDGATVAQQTQTVPGNSDYGPKTDIAAVKKAIHTQVGDPGNVSVSHDWALGRAFTEHAALSVVMHRTNGQWKVTASDGGVFVPSLLQAQGVPAADATNLVKVYQ